MKKLPLLLVMLFASLGTAWAQNHATSVDQLELTTDTQHPVYYTIKSYRSTLYLTVNASGTLCQQGLLDKGSFWYITQDGDGYQLHCATGKHYAGSTFTAADAAGKCYLGSNAYQTVGGQVLGFYISTQTQGDANTANCLDDSQGGGFSAGWSPRSGDYMGTTWQFTKTSITDGFTSLQTQAQALVSAPRVGDAVVTQDQVDTYVSSYITGKTTLEEYGTALTQLQALNTPTGENWVKPDPAKYYRVVSAYNRFGRCTKAIYAESNGNLGWQNRDEDALAQVWQFTGSWSGTYGDYRMVSVLTDKKAGNCSADGNAVPTTADGSKMEFIRKADATFSCPRGYVLNLRTGGNTCFNTKNHNNGASAPTSSGDVVGNGGFAAAASNLTNSASAWYLEEVPASALTAIYRASLTTALAGVGTRPGYFTLTAEAQALVTAAQAADATVEQMKAAIAAANNAEGRTLNQPVAGTYYRLKAASNNAYVSVTSPTVKGTFVTDPTGANEASTILYLSLNNELLSYVAGYVYEREQGYFNDPLAQSGTHDQCVFKQGSVPGTLAINVQGDRAGWLHAWADALTNANHANLDRCSSDAGSPASTDGAHAFYFEPVEKLPVQVSQAGYATLYAAAPLTLPEGLNAYTVSVEDKQIGEDRTGEITLTPYTGTLPKLTGFVLAGEANTYRLPIASENPAEVESGLTGAVDCQTIAADNDNVFILAGGTAGVGFYKLSSQSRTLKGHKAWLEYTPSAGAAGVNGFVFRQGGATAVQTASMADADAKTAAYDLTGRRVRTAQKGLYIVGGKKVIR